MKTVPRPARNANRSKAAKQSAKAAKASAQIPTPLAKGIHLLMVVENGKAAEIKICPENAEMIRCAALAHDTTPLQFIARAATGEAVTHPNPGPINDASPIRAEIRDTRTHELLFKLDLSEAEWRDVQIRWAAYLPEDRQGDDWDVPSFVRRVLAGKVPSAAAYFSDGELAKLKQAVEKKEQFQTGWTTTRYIQDSVIRQMVRDLTASPIIDLESASNEAIAMLELLSSRIIKLKEKQPSHVLGCYAAGVSTIVSLVQQRLRDMVEDTIDYAAGRAPKEEGAPAVAA